MRVTDAMRDGLAQYKLKTGSTNVEIGRLVRMTPQNLGRLIAGKTTSTNDDSGQKILQLLGLEEPGAVSQAPTAFVRVNYHGTAMSPLIVEGDVLMAQPVIVGDLEEGSLVVAEWKTTRGKRSTLGYFSMTGSKIEIKHDDQTSCTCTFGDLVWIMKIILPARTIEIGDGK